MLKESNSFELLCIFVRIYQKFSALPVVVLWPALLLPSMFPLIPLLFCAFLSLFIYSNGWYELLTGVSGWRFGLKSDSTRPNQINRLYHTTTSHNTSYLYTPSPSLSHLPSFMYPSSPLSVPSSSPPDLRIRRECWTGHIPIVFQLASNEVTTMEVPPPIALLLPRQSYFPLLLSDVRHHFIDMTPAREDELWLEFDGIPLPWTIPVGVLFDLLVTDAHSYDGNGSGTTNGTGTTNLHDLALPWKLIVHFQMFPASKLQRCRSLFTVRQHYLNTWKESCYLRFSSTRVAMSCLAADHQRMWDALVHLREDVHTQTVQRVIAAGLIGGHQQSNTNLLTPPNASTPTSASFALLHSALEHQSSDSLPIRIYIHSTRPSSSEGQLSDSHCTPIQRIIKPKAKDGHDQTMKDLIVQVLPGLIDHTASQSNPPAAASESTDPARVVDSSISGEIALLPNVRILIQGFCPPLSTPLSWLCTYASHPDGFLYVAVHIVEQETEEELARRDPFGNMSAGMGMDSMSMGMGVGMGMGMGGYGHGLANSFGLGGVVSTVTNFSPSTIPGYHAASNAMNVVYQNLPSILPSVTLPNINMTSLFGANQSQQQQQPQSQPQSTNTDLSGSTLPPSSDSSAAFFPSSSSFSSSTSGDVPVSPPIQRVSEGDETSATDSFGVDALTIRREEEELP